MIKPEQIPDEVVEAAARAIIIANGGDPDALLRLTIHKTTIKAWQQVAPLARTTCLAMLKAWPGMEIEMVFVEEDYLMLPLPRQNSND